MSDRNDNDPDYDFAVDLTSQVAGVGAAMLLHNSLRKTVYGPHTMEIVMEAAQGLLSTLRKTQGDDWYNLLHQHFHASLEFLQANRQDLAVQMTQRCAAFNTKTTSGPCPFNTPEWWETGKLPTAHDEPPSWLADFLKGREQ